MIGRLSGQLAYRAADHVMIDVGGVGYLVYCSDRTMAGLPAKGGFVSLYTDLLVREDLLQLFGFQTLAEKEWYRLLTTVQGVGAKAAVAILGTLGPDGVSRAIALGDAAAVKAAPGVGPKIAQRVVNELRDKAPSIMAMAGVGAQPAAPASPHAGTGAAAPVPAPQAAAAPANATAQSDALSALTNLGYSASDAAAAVAQAAGEAPDAPTETLIRAALRLLAPKD
ncbi:Holliday junction branch migration protein RuvA [Meridianimarinicoccus roseus]|uniref:Holliday junction branch migration complex subunit RuvA n=1 Tax=Meridianimarinicoccus roseus TaxID=2072018 RepID=A0A2V2LER2_9RHOB|nr:Holliday junction branch migration protein RuvA [Meridianimarinicoccus roseus]PWR03945.1 Holliday junction branch migration protein RuvA [Meridianimarinicoccus roseus]